MNEIIFAEGSVPVSVAAKVFGKDACWMATNRNGYKKQSKGEESRGDRFEIRTNQFLYLAKKVI